MSNQNDVNNRQEGGTAGASGGYDCSGGSEETRRSGDDRVTVRDGRYDHGVHGVRACAKAT